MYYVYILKSQITPNTHYVGYTKDLKKRFNSHNTGNVTSTKKYKPWKIINYVAFHDEKQARNFEKYLKTGSGTAFRQKYFQ